MVARDGRITAHYTCIEGIEETSEKNITVWPNPVIDIFHIEECDERARFFVYNVDGRKMHLTTRGDGQSDLSALLSGIHCLSIKENDKTIIIKISKFNINATFAEAGSDTTYLPKQEGKIPHPV